MRKHYSLMLVCICTSNFSLGQDSLKTTMLQEVVTTATRYEREVIEIPRSVTVVGSDAINRQSYNSVGELLSNYGGLYITGALQTPGSTQTMFMRGAAGNQVAIMIDGVRINDPTSPNAALDLNELSLINVDRIEVIRGSHSTLYGGAAVGGVVNILTKKGMDPGFHGNIIAQAGTFGKSTSTLTESIGLDYTFKKGVYINASLFNQNVNGLNAALDTLSDVSGFHTTDQDDFAKTDANFKIGLKNKTWDGFISYKRTDQHADIDDGAYNDDDNAFLDFKRNFVNYKIEHDFSAKWKLSAIGSWSNSKRLIVNDSSVVDENGKYDATFSDGIYRGRIMTNELQLNYRHNKITGVVGAGRYDEDMNFQTYFFNRSIFGDFTSIVNYDTLDTSSTTNYAFGQINFAFEGFDLALGTRWSNHSLFGDFWSLEANPSYLIRSTLLYASFSTGFNSPSLYQLFDPSRGFNAYTTRGNMQLEAERSTSLELGIKKEFDGGSFITLSAYRTETREAIEYVYLWNKDTPVEDLTFADNRGDTYLNTSRQVVNGVEVEGNASLGKFSLLGNISWIDGYIYVKPSDLDATETGGNHVQLFNYGVFVTNEFEVDKLVRRPNLTAYVQLSFAFRADLSACVAYRHAGSRFDSGYDESLGPYGALNQFEVRKYNLIDLAMNWDIRKDLALGLKVENLFDESYQEILGFQTRGRSAYVKLSYSW